MNKGLSLAAKAARNAAKSSTTAAETKSKHTDQTSTDQKPDTSSPYFSPRKTRNQIKIQYDNTSSTSSSTASKTAVAPEKHSSTSSSVISKKTSKKHKLNTTDKDSLNNIKTEPLPDNKPTDEKMNKWEPRNWKQTLENIRQMRKNEIAPVDTMGCHKCSDDDADEKTKRYHILIALMLSSQTKDQITYDAMNRLKQHGLTPENMVKSTPNLLEQLIIPVSFYKNKTKFIQKASQILIDQYDSDIPNTVDGLMKLPGVGSKMAHICMNSAWNIVTGIGVDTHVHRISNRLNWVQKPTKEPEKTRLQLEQWLPYELWHDVNELLVGFGQTICTPTNPKCNQCINQKICPFAAATASSKIKTKK